MQPNHSELEYTSRTGVTFKIRAEATNRDKSMLNILMGESSVVEEGCIIRVNFLKAFPFLIERFVTGWSGGPQTNGRDVLNFIYDQPADPVEDIVMVLGSYILNHVKGLGATREDEHKKKGS